MTNDPIDWLFGDGEEAEFDQADTILITGLSDVSLQNWATRGIFKPSAGGGSQGVKRRYSAKDTIVLAMSRRLVDLNLTANVSLSLALDVWMATLKEVKRTNDFASITSSIAFIKTTGGKLRTQIVSGSNAFDFTQLLDGQPVIMFAAGAVIKSTAVRAMEVSGIAEQPARYRKEPA